MVVVAPLTVCGQVCGELAPPGVEDSQVLVVASEGEERRAGRAGVDVVGDLMAREARVDQALHAGEDA